MAGILTISTLSDGTNSTSSTNCIQGSAKAWVSLTGSTGAIRSSYNVSSITRTTTGQFTVAFTNAMTDANYSVVGACSYATGAGSVFFAPCTSGTTAVAPTTSSFVFSTSAYNSSTYDAAYTNVSVFR